MKNEKTLVIFGAPDHEEKLARRVAEAAGCTTATATCKGKPVHAGNAYMADGHRLDAYHLNQDGVTIDYPEIIVMFECGKGATERIIHFICDHHNPGDRGFGLGPGEYWHGSSLGQMCYYLGFVEVEQVAALTGIIEEDLLMTAAGDHCPKDAYSGKCDYISKYDFFRFRLRQKAEFEFSGLSEEQQDATSVENVMVEIAERIKKTECILAKTEKVNGIADLREYGFIPELREAALKNGLAYMAKIDEADRDGNQTGNKKIVLGGCTTPEQVKEFMAWAANLDNRVGDPYGNPTRGFAGVIVRN